ncbi:MAG TPA: hypothetical protein VFI25_11955 [Planctomycetota bacterium]|jgi:hypothetical protein|nr:hypothetical protein [Planctomycetota bacterium]
MNRARLARTFLLASLLAESSSFGQVCAPGQVLLKNDILPAFPSGPMAVSVIQGLCEGEACAAVFDVSGLGVQVKVHSAAVGYLNVASANGIQAATDLEIFDGVTWSGGIPTLGPSLFRWSTATGSSIGVASSGINLSPALSSFNVVATSGKIVVAWWMEVNALAGTCPSGYSTNFATDNTCTGFFCSCGAGTQKNLIFIQGQGWRDAATATVSGAPLCPLYYNGNWLIRACVEPVACPAPLVLGAGTPGTGGVVPVLVASGGSPQIGNAGFGLTIAAARGGAPALLVLNAVETSVPFAGGTIFVLPGAAVPLPLGGPAGVAGAGFATVSLPIPNDLSLVSATVSAQAGILDPAANSSVALTAGLRVTVCP